MLDFLQLKRSRMGYLRLQQDQNDKKTENVKNQYVLFLLAGKMWFLLSECRMKGRQTRHLEIRKRDVVQNFVKCMVIVG